MGQPSHSPSPAPQDHSSPNRYHDRADQPVDPGEELHPEMADGEQAAPIASGIPSSPQELIAMQAQVSRVDSDCHGADRPEKAERISSPKVNEVLQLIKKLDTSSFEDQQIALALLRHLEEFHDGVVEELRDDRFAKHSQIIAWAIDADRLLRARVLLESVDLE